jgi:hypothetical protein
MERRGHKYLRCYYEFPLESQLKRAYCPSDYPDCDFRFVTSAAQSRNKSACLSDTQQQRLPNLCQLRRL